MQSGGGREDWNWEPLLYTLSGKKNSMQSLNKKVIISEKNLFFTTV